MRPTSLAILWGLAFICGTDPLWGQKQPLEQAPLPEGPLLPKPPNVSAWQIDYAYASDKEPPQAPTLTDPKSFVLGKARRITLTFVRPAWHAVYENVEGMAIEEWSDGKGSYYKGSGQPDYEVVPFHDEGSDPVVPDFGKDPFSELKWVSAENYKGIQELPGHRCLVFKSGEMTAWIDLESRAPIQWQRENEVRTYTRLANPAALLEFPSQVLALMAEHKKFESRLSFMTNRPG